MFRLVVIDDQRHFAEVVRASMGKDPDFEAIGHATNLADGLAHISERHPNVRVVVLAAFANAPMVTSRGSLGQGVPRVSHQVRWGE